eukprot:TRINITY_DN4509_c0_g1_i4.p1 TRINITY_DN4509_c0_g1~~TRINITY_DN4509_c0_g1_i4.p1  ORF type:complete len:364 (-),score=87.72 TRINITY_DN4509_c0_g1_i4:787-1878(-)
MKDDLRTAKQPAAKNNWRMAKRMAKTMNSSTKIKLLVAKRRAKTEVELLRAMQDEFVVPPERVDDLAEQARVIRAAIAHFVLQGYLQHTFNTRHAPVSDFDRFNAMGKAVLRHAMARRVLAVSMGPPSTLTNMICRPTRWETMAMLFVELQLAQHFSDPSRLPTFGTSCTLEYVKAMGNVVVAVLGELDARLRDVHQTATSANDPDHLRIRDTVERMVSLALDYGSLSKMSLQQEQMMLSAPVIPKSRKDLATPRKMTKKERKKLAASFANLPVTKTKKQKDLATPRKMTKKERKERKELERKLTKLTKLAKRPSGATHEEPGEADEAGRSVRRQGTEMAGGSACGDDGESEEDGGISRGRGA